MLILQISSIPYPLLIDFRRLKKIKTNPYSNFKTIELYGLVLYLFILLLISSCASISISVPITTKGSHINGVALKKLRNGIYQTYSYNHLPCDKECSVFKETSKSYLILNVKYSLISYKINFSGRLKKKIQSLSKQKQDRFLYTLNILFEQIDSSYSNNLFSQQLPIDLDLTLLEQGESIENKTYVLNSENKAKIKFFKTTPTHIFFENFGSIKIAISIAQMIAHEIAHISIANHRFSNIGYSNETTNEEAKADLFSQFLIAESIQTINKKFEIQLYLNLKLSKNNCQQIENKQFNLDSFTIENETLSESQVGYMIGVANLANLFGSCRIGVVNADFLREIRLQIKKSYVFDINIRESMLSLPQ